MRLYRADEEDLNLDVGPRWRRDYSGGVPGEWEELGLAHSWPFYYFNAAVGELGSSASRCMVGTVINNECGTLLAPSLFRSVGEGSATSTELW